MLSLVLLWTLVELWIASVVVVWQSLMRINVVVCYIVIFVVDVVFADFNIDEVATKVSSTKHIRQQQH